MGIGINNPTNTIDVNGSARVRSLADVSNDTSYDRSVVANSDGVLAYKVLGTGGNIDVGQRVAIHKRWPTSTANGRFLSQDFSDLPVLDGKIMVDVEKVSGNTLYSPVIRNITASGVKITYLTLASVSGNERVTDGTLAAGGFYEVDPDNIVYWNGSHETDDTHLVIDNDKWYFITWWAFTVGSFHEVRITVERLR